MLAGIELSNREDDQKVLMLDFVTTKEYEKDASDYKKIGKIY